jgi:hypothetical protein
MASNLAFGIALEISREVLAISLTSHLNLQRMPISRSASPVCDVSSPQDAGHVRKLEVELDCEENVSVSSSGITSDEALTSLIDQGWVIALTTVKEAAMLIDVALNAAFFTNNEKNHNLDDSTSLVI